MARRLLGHGADPAIANRAGVAASIIAGETRR